MEYIAFDAHKRYTLASVVRPDGQLVREQRIAHERGALQQFLERCEQGSPVAVETIGNWYWIVDEIEAAGCVPKLVHARKAKLMMGEINKTDRLDADTPVSYAVSSVSGRPPNDHGRPSGRAGHRIGEGQEPPDGGGASGGAGARGAGGPGARVPDQIAEHVHEERGPEDAEAGERGEPPGGVERTAAGPAEHSAPDRDARGDPDAEEAQARLGHDRVGERRRRQHDDRREHVREQWRTMIRPSPAPVARAPSMKARSRSVSTSLRTTRAK